MFLFHPEGQTGECSDQWTVVTMPHTETVEQDEAAHCIDEAEYSEKSHHSAYIKDLHPDYENCEQCKCTCEVNVDKVVMAVIRDEPAKKQDPLAGGIAMFLKLMSHVFETYEMAKCNLKSTFTSITFIIER